ncbi:MAG TPA: hypothetical protein VL486_07295 [Verrucomicrobiae bacterium]|nr:hypothetical protein [Verrucomicrobiae bacterium]
MTAEIAVLNKSAVALAADSAVTIQHEMGYKVYNTMNKLFALHKPRPVGVMIYGGAELMGIPWETIIRVYQARYSQVKFNRLAAYGKHFISFLDRRNPLFPLRSQREHFESIVEAHFTVIRQQLEDVVKEEIDKKGQVDNSRITVLADEMVASHLQKWRQFKRIKTFPRNHRRKVLKRHGRAVSKTLKKVFQKVPLSGRARRGLRSVAIDFFCKNRFSSNSSGVVIAGFGEKDVFPALVSFEVELVVNDRLKYQEGRKHQVALDDPACVIPFAQEDVVVTLVEGADPSYQELVRSSFSEILRRYAEGMVKGLKLADKKREQRLLDALLKFGIKLEEGFTGELRVYKIENHIRHLLDVVRMLPKDELAAMAESLVNLTSLKRKMSLATETVGGPIDVAVISKGEGMIWIKRKHYFTKDLNPQFFQRYHKESQTEV